MGSIGQIGSVVVWGSFQEGFPKFPGLLGISSGLIVIYFFGGEGTPFVDWLQIATKGTQHQ